MDHLPLEGSNIRVHSCTMSRGCTRITKPPYTPPRGTCLFVNLLIRLRVTDNKCMSSSYKCEYSKVDTSTTHIFPASLVPCIALSHLESWRILRRCIQTLDMIRSVIISLLNIFPQNIHHTYPQGISLAFPRYIAMQQPSYHDLIFMSYMP